MKKLLVVGIALAFLAWPISNIQAKPEPFVSHDHQELSEEDLDKQDQWLEDKGGWKGAFVELWLRITGQWEDVDLGDDPVVEKKPDEKKSIYDYIPEAKERDPFFDEVERSGN